MLRAAAFVDGRRAPLATTRLAPGACTSGDGNVTVTVVHDSTTVQMRSAACLAGAYRVDASPALGDGTYSVQASQTDPIGNTGTSAARDFTVDTTGPTVTVKQAAGQDDPTDTSPIEFRVVFSEPVDDFASGDVTLSGSARATTAAVSGSGTTYTISVSGMTSGGAVTASVPAGVAHDAVGNGNSAGADDTVDYKPAPPSAEKRT